MLMSFPALVQRYNLKITGLLHVGAHLAEEASMYANAGIRDVWWIEANPRVQRKILQTLRAFPGQRLIEALVYEKDGVKLDFNVTNYDGMSSSILEFGTHPEFSPDTKFVEKLRLRTRTIDSLAEEHRIVDANFLSMDLQGAELFALKGAHRFLQSVDYVLSEVNQVEVYRDCAQVDELDAFLHEFARVETYWVPAQGWGDALWIRKHQVAS